MKRWTFIATRVSAVFCVLSLLLIPVGEFYCVLSEYVAPGEVAPHSIPLPGRFRCGVSRCRAYIYSAEIPYTGSLRFLDAGPNHVAHGFGVARVTRDWTWNVGESGIIQESYHDHKTGQLVGRDRAATFPGIYYRDFNWPHYGPSWMTLFVSLWYPILLFAILPALWAFRRYRTRKTTILPKPAATPHSALVTQASDLLSRRDVSP